jgi:hypothetical protein
VTNSERANQVGHAVQQEYTACGGSKLLFVENHFMSGISSGAVVF